MEIPKFLKDKIDEDTKLAGIVNTAISKTHNIINKAQPDFFPEYTDHGPDHNTDVLASAVDLIADDAKDIFSSADAAALTLAVLLHDCGMHLTPDGFRTLIASDYRGVDGLDDTTWLELWNDYMMQARRYDERTLINIFGDAHPIGDDPVDKQPIDLTVRDKMLIGDFLRRHHPRLAHEIALNGFPGIEGNIALFDEKCDIDLCSAWGMIARSHGMVLRQANDEFARMFDRYEFRNIHGCHLMVLLRIADLMQIQAERAPEGVFQIKKLKSPFSQGEWKVHQSISNITRAGTDPEAISIKAEPESVEIFLKIKGWTDYLQTELDQSWAVLGEEYGRQDEPPLKNLQLKLRRVKTNFDDIKKFGENVEYVPRKIAFDTNNPDLLNLLVGPLYDERPEIGIRELMQNAVDAVRERTEIEGISPAELINGKDDDVSICIDGDEERGMTVTISDRGIGMNLDIIENYFLKAGSSFRNSATWKKDFQDDEGNSKIQRSGRFGIGALAAFLIGRKANVKTRRCGEDHGYEFVAELGKSALTVTRCECPVGTKIEVTVDKNKQKSLSRNQKPKHNTENFWDFYIYDAPKVARYRNKKRISQGFTYTSNLVSIGDFQTIEYKDYNTVSFSLSKHFSKAGIRRRYRPHLFCNGILVTNRLDTRLWTRSLDSKYIEINMSKRSSVRDRSAPIFQVPMPSILLDDPNNKLSINLQRNTISKFDEGLTIKIAKSLIDDFIATIIADAPEMHILDCYEHLYGATCATAFCELRDDQSFTNNNSKNDWIWLNGHWSPFDGWFHDYNVKSKLIYEGSGIDWRDNCFELISNNCVLSRRKPTPDLDNKVANFIREDFRVFNSLFEKGDGVDFFTCVNSKLLETKQTQGLLKQYQTNYSKKCSIENLGNSSVIYTTSFTHPAKDNLITLAANTKSSSIKMFTYYDNIQYELKNDQHFFKRWKSLCGDQLIPWRWEDRVKAFPRAFEVLGDRIEYHRAQKLKAEKETKKP